jgi:hypothetical protein
MSSRHKLFMQIRMLFGRNRAAERLQDELRFHLDQQISENIASGMSPDDARKAAIRAFGDPGLIREQVRATWNWYNLDKLSRDLKYGVRTLLRSPGFAIVSVLVMALGIGATTSLFTMVSAVLLRPLPFRDSGKLVMLYEHFRDVKSGDGFNAVAPGDYRDWRSQTHGFEDMAAMRGYGGIVSGVHSELPEVVQSAGGSANLFPLLGVTPVYGRLFTEAEDQPNAEPVVLLTWSLFQRRFAGDPSIIGKQIHLDTIPTTVIGVLPNWFNYPDARIQFWMPYAQTFTPQDYGIHDGHQSTVVARIKAGVSVGAATREVSALQYQIHLANASKPVAEDVWSRPMINDVIKDVKRPLLVLLCSVICMLLIACLNVSNLQVARAAARRREVAIRSALGGSRLALVREQMTESLLICGGRGRTGAPALTGFHALAGCSLAQFAARRYRSCGWMGVRLCCWTGCGDCDAGGPASGHFFHRQRITQCASGVIALDWGKRLASPSAQGDADCGDRADSDASRRCGPAFSQLCAPAHCRSRLPHRSCADHEIRSARNSIQYTREGPEFPPVAA